MEFQSRDPDLVRNNPNVDLLKTLLKHLLPTNKECRILGRVVDIDEDTNAVVFIALPFVCPDAVKGLRCVSRRSKAVHKLLSSKGKFEVFDGRSVIVPGWQDYLVASERHRPG